MLGTNALAFLAFTSVMKKKMTPGVIIIILFSPSLTKRPNKLKCLQSLIFVNMARAYQSEAPFGPGRKGLPEANARSQIESDEARKNSFVKLKPGGINFIKFFHQ